MVKNFKNTAILFVFFTCIVNGADRTKICFDTDSPFYATPYYYSLKQLDLSKRDFIKETQEMIVAKNPTVPMFSLEKGLETFYILRRSGLIYDVGNLALLFANSTLESSFEKNARWLKLTHDTLMYRYHGKDNIIGKEVTWVVDIPYESEEDLRKYLAIRKEWGTDLQYETKILLKQGVLIVDGLSANKGVGYEGMRYRAFFDTKTADYEILETKPAFPNQHIIVSDCCKPDLNSAYIGFDPIIVSKQFNNSQAFFITPLSHYHYRKYALNLTSYNGDKKEAEHYLCHYFYDPFIALILAQRYYEEGLKDKAQFWFKDAVKNDSIILESYHKKMCGELSIFVH